METEKGTKLAGIKREISAWLQSFMNKPVRTFLLLFGIIVFIGLASIAPRAANDLYSLVFPLPSQNPFSKTQTIYSNIVPTADDIIDLDHAGNLTPAPYNTQSIVQSSSGICIPKGDTLPYIQGIVMMLNAAPLMSSHDFKDPAIPARGMAFNLPPFSNYFIFKAGTTHKITTNGRTFLIGLSYINDLSTTKNGSYFSYVFNINEK